MLCQITQKNPWKHQKYSKRLKSSLNNVHIAYNDLLWAFYKLFDLQFYDSNDQWKNIVQLRFY